MSSGSVAGKKYRILHLIIKSVKETDYNKFRWSNLDLTKILVPFRLLIHPIDTCNDIKYEGRGSLGLANIIAFLYFAFSVIRSVSFGFIFNQSYGQAFNVWPVFIQSIGLLLLWVISSWSLSTLLDGEGKFKEIWITSCYSMMPVVLITIPLVVLSNFLLVEETYFITLFEYAMTLWSLILMFASTMVVQQYSVSKTILIMLLSALGIFSIVFLVIMFFSLFQQLYIFIDSVSKEMLFRV